MIGGVARVMPFAQSSSHTSKASSAGTDSALSITVYMLDDKCIYSGGGHNGQSVNVVYTDDSTAEDPIVKIFGKSISGNYEEVVHLNDIDPTNATYAELCALLAYQNRIGAYTPAANKLLMPTPLNVDPGSYSERKNYVSLIQNDVSNTDYVDVIDYTKELLDFFEQYVNKCSEEEDEIFTPAQIDYAGHLRVDMCR